MFVRKLSRSRTIMRFSLLRPPPPPSPTAPASQCAPDPTLDETVPLDPEVIAINNFVSQAHGLQVNLEEQYYCMDCAMLQSVISPDLSKSD